MLLVSISKACHTVHPSFWVFKHIQIWKGLMWRKSFLQGFCCTEIFVFSMCVFTLSSIGYGLIWAVTKRTACLHSSQIYPKECLAKIWNLSLVHKDWSSFHHSHSRNGVSGGGNYLLFAVVPKQSFPEKMWASEAVLRGQESPCAVWMCAWSHREQLALEPRFCTQLSSRLELDTGQSFQSTELSICA